MSTKMLSWLGPFCVHSLPPHHLWAHFKPSKVPLDAAVVVWELQTLVNNATSDINRARLLAVKAVHGSDCLFALPISA